MDIWIRTADVEDLPALRRVFREAALSNEAEATLPLGHPHHLVFTGDGIAEGRTHVAVVLGDVPVTPAQASIAGTGGAAQEVLGFLTASPTAADGEWEVEDLFVDPPFHRRGIARALVEEAVARATASGVRRLVVTANTHALPFYTAVGFVKIGRTITELGAEAPVMRRDLRPPTRA